MRYAVPVLPVVFHSNIPDPEILQLPQPAMQRHECTKLDAPLSGTVH